MNTQKIKYIVTPVADEASIADDVYTSKVKRVSKEAEKLKIEFDLLETCGQFARNYDTEVSVDCPFYEDMVKILGRDLQTEELNSELDLNALLQGKECRLVILKKRGAGGRIKSDIITVLPLTREVK